MPSLRSSESIKAYWAFAALGPFAIYGIVLALLGLPFIQKQQVYVLFVEPGHSKRPPPWPLALNRVLMQSLDADPEANQ
jgi:hypothetical protein